jgi:sulfopyruvate decarboxylase subunit alpha
VRPGTYRQPGGRAAPSSRERTVADVNAAIAEPLDWQRAIADALVAADVSLVAYVPDARLRGVISALGARTSVRTLTREEECVGYACGYAAAGGRPAVLFQCSGLGNALNALGSFAIPYAIGIPLVLSMRGTLGEENPAQVPMGRATTALLDSLGIPCYPVTAPEQAGPTMTGVLASAYAAATTSALLLEPQLGGQREGG